MVENFDRNFPHPAKVSEVGSPLMVDDHYVDLPTKTLKLLNSRFELREELGRGAHGRLYTGRDRRNGAGIAVKIMENIVKNKSKYLRELQLMKEMAALRASGFCRVIHSEADRHNFYIVMDLLGPSIKDLQNKQESKHLIHFSVKTVTMIGLQLLYRLETMHKAGFVHRDLKPANMCVGRSKFDQNIIYLIDYGLSKKLTQQSIVKATDAGKVVGTAIFVAQNVHVSPGTYTKMDDLESLLYVLAYLLRGTLPWKVCKTTDMSLDHMYQMKSHMSAKEVFGEKAPPPFVQMLDFVKTSHSEGTPDYAYLEGMFKQIASQEKFKFDGVFDWSKPDQLKAQANQNSQTEFPSSHKPLMNSYTHEVIQYPSPSEVGSSYIGKSNFCQKESSVMMDQQSGTSKIAKSCLKMPQNRTDVINVQAKSEFGEKPSPTNDIIIDEDEPRKVQSRDVGSPTRVQDGMRGNSKPHKKKRKKKTKTKNTAELSDVKSALKDRRSGDEESKFNGPDNLVVMVLHSSDSHAALSDPLLDNLRVCQVASSGGGKDHTTSVAPSSQQHNQPILGKISEEISARKSIGFDTDTYREVFQPENLEEGDINKMMIPLVKEPQSNIQVLGKSRHNSQMTRNAFQAPSLIQQ